MAYNASESELRIIREMARRGCGVRANQFSLRCSNAKHSHPYETVYRAALTLGAWLECGTGDLCSHNHRTEDAAHNCAARFLKLFDLKANENWRHES